MIHHAFAAAAALLSQAAQIHVSEASDAVDAADERHFQALEGPRRGLAHARRLSHLAKQAAGFLVGKAIEETDLEELRELRDKIDASIARQEADDSARVARRGPTRQAKRQADREARKAALAPFKEAFKSLKNKAIAHPEQFRGALEALGAELDRRTAAPDLAGASVDVAGLRSRAASACGSAFPASVCLCPKCRSMLEDA